MIIFDGYLTARQREADLAVKVAKLTEQGIFIDIKAILFEEDAGSQLYTRLKKEAAHRVGMEYEAVPFSMKSDVNLILPIIEKFNLDTDVTGIIIQKPSKSRWMEVTGKTGEEFQEWWSSLSSKIALEKDVDGLHPDTLAAVKEGTWREDGLVMPATAQACLDILKIAKESDDVDVELDLESKYIVIGKSDILGKPLYYELLNQGKQVEMIGSKELQARQETGEDLLDADVIITATGRPGILKGSLIKEGVIVIDVGEPKSDVEQESVREKAAFLTPVPGGVGPMTVMCLLENAVKLVQK